MTKDFNIEYSEMLSERRLDNVFDDLGKLSSKERALILSLAVELKRFLFLHQTGQKIDLVWSERDPRVDELFDLSSRPTPEESLCIFFLLLHLDHADELLESRNAE